MCRRAGCRLSNHWPWRDQRRASATCPGGMGPVSCSCNDERAGANRDLRGRSGRCTDDANVSRFCELLDEMCRQTDTRFMIITHHAITMSRMDRLFGVTMQEQGVSQLVSVDLQKAESLVA